MTAGFPMPGQNIAFPGFPFGFPAQGFAGDGAGEEAGKGGGKVPSFMDSAGNIDFMKMAALVSLQKARKLTIKYTSSNSTYAMISNIHM